MLILLMSSSVWAQSQTQLQEIPRKILAIYQPKQDPDIYYSAIHKYAEFPLNHLGLEVVYRSLLEPLPTLSEMQGFRGVITWFSDSDVVPNPDQYCDWMKAQIENGIKFVILGEVGFFKPKQEELSPACQSAFNAFGAKYLNGYTENPFFIEVVKKDPDMVEFERKLKLEEGVIYSPIEVIDPDSKIYLQIKRTDLPDSLSSVVFTNSKGGFAYATYIYYINEALDKMHWRLNPFKFFEEAFAVQGLPRPDTTTINGRRIYYSHIDGDGIFNVGQHPHKPFSGEIIYDEILKKYSSLPFTASIITGYLDIPEYETDRAQALYKNIFNLPNVEPASHGYAHPLIWSKDGPVSLKIEGYQFSAKKEIIDSTEMINNLLKKDQIPKTSSLFLWTGDCVPTRDQIGVTYQNGLLNMNGGDSRFDKKYDSYTNLAPIGINRNGERQIYSSTPNENIYVNMAKGPFYGFYELVETFKNTEEPFRVKPINIYYHYYSAEKYVLLKILKGIYEYVVTQNIFPIYASEYVRLAQDYFTTKIFSLPEGGYRITHQDNLRTLRFDREARQVDLNKSKGVIGFQHYQNNLYVFFDDSKTHDVYLSDQPQTKAYIVDASFHIKDFKADQKEISFLKQGWFKTEADIGGLKPQEAYSIQTNKGTLHARTDAQGLLHLSQPNFEGDGPYTKVVIKNEAL